MPEEEVVRVPCSRCDQLHETTRLTYQNNGGQTYCEECLVPFECGKCGERRYTVPEKVSEEKTIVCKYCTETKSSDSEENSSFSLGDSPINLGKFWLKSMSRLLAVILSLGILNVLYQSFVFMIRTPLSVLEIIGLWVIVTGFVWVVAYIIEGFWKWEPS